MDKEKGVFTLPDGKKIEVEIESLATKPSPGNYKINGQEIVVEKETKPKPEG